MHYGNVIVLWNNDPAASERDALTQESRLRSTVEGQRFAYANFLPTAGPVNGGGSPEH